MYFYKKEGHRDLR